MKKTLLILVVALCSFFNSNAQLPDGSVAPDFDLVDLNGTNHNLYNLLDAGYTVFIDFSAVWCPPCWSYHQTHALENLYVNHGPAGYPNVSQSTTDDVMVFYIEADANNVASLGGSGANTQGDWITGTSYPIICTDGTMNNNQVSSDYSIGYFPTIYMICPDRLTTLVGQSSNPYPLSNSGPTACPPAASNDNDARTFSYTGETLTCEGDIIPEITIQNYGLVNLTSLTIDVIVNGNTASSTPWSGNLTTYATANINLPQLTGLTGGETVSINVSQPNGVADADPSNNPAVGFNVSMATQNTDIEVTVNIATDAYGSETTWNIKNSSNQTVASGGPYSNQSSAGSYPQTPVVVTLSTLECHTFTILDSYGDGMDSGYGNGTFSVVDGNGITLASGGAFTDSDGAAWKTGNSTPASINDLGSKLLIYPNPVKNTLNITGEYDNIEIYDVYGKLVLSSNYKEYVNVEGLSNGIYIMQIDTRKEKLVQKITVAK